MAHQCPRCELRFLTNVEVRDHLILEHGMTPEQLEQPYPLPGRAGLRSHSERSETSRADPADRGEGAGEDRAPDSDRRV